MRPFGEPFPVAHPKGPGSRWSDPCLAERGSLVAHPPSFSATSDHERAPRGGWVHLDHLCGLEWFHGHAWTQRHHDPELTPKSTCLKPFWPLNPSDSSGTRASRTRALCNSTIARIHRDARNAVRKPWNCL